MRLREHRVQPLGLGKLQVQKNSNLMYQEKDEVCKIYEVRGVETPQEIARTLTIHGCQFMAKDRKLQRYSQEEGWNEHPNKTLGGKSRLPSHFCHPPPTCTCCQLLSHLPSNVLCAFQQVALGKKKKKQVNKQNNTKALDRSGVSFVLLENLVQGILFLLLKFTILASPE